MDKDPAQPEFNQVVVIFQDNNLMCGPGKAAHAGGAA